MKPLFLFFCLICLVLLLCLGISARTTHSISLVAEIASLTLYTRQLSTAEIRCVVIKKGWISCGLSCYMVFFLTLFSSGIPYFALD